MRDLLGVHGDTTVRSLKKKLAGAMDVAVSEPLEAASFFLRTLRASFFRLLIVLATVMKGAGQ